MIGTALRGRAMGRIDGERARRFAQTYGALVALLLLVLFNALFTRNFLSLQTINVNLTQVATIVIVAVGMTMLLVNETLTAMGLNVVLAWVLPVLVAGAFGLFNGFQVAHLRIQPVIATLVLFIAGRGIAQVVTNGNLQVFRNETFQFVGTGRPFGIPFQVILMLVIVAATVWLLRATLFGRYVVAVGGNEEAARLAGVPVRRVKLAVYGISGMLSGIAGLIVISLNSSSDANQVGLNMELDAIAAVAVGGTPLTGGHVTVVGTLIGACIMQLTRFTLLAHGVPDAAAFVVKAAIIVAAVYVQRQRE
jgi:galactofuranose transport system permease protein